MTELIRQKAEWNEFASPEDLAEALSERIGEALIAAIAARGSATLAVSGGRTPKRLFDVLSRLPIAWGKVTVVLVDERFVPTDDERSNERLVRNYLLKDRAGKAQFLPLYRQGVSVEDAAAKADEEVAALPAPLDVVVLGMGPDGHTASFFPDARDLHAFYANRQGRAVLPVHAESAGEPRLTLSMQLLAGAHLLLLHIESEERRAVLMRALTRGDLPIARFLAEAASVPHIYWAP